MTSKNNRNQIFVDPLKQVIQNDRIVDLVSNEILNDSVYVENYELFDSGKINREDFIEIINQLVLKYKKQIKS
jgi:hypothetical protein